MLSYTNGVADCFKNKNMANFSTLIAKHILVTLILLLFFHVNVLFSRRGSNGKTSNLRIRKSDHLHSFINTPSQEKQKY